MKRKSVPSIMFRVFVSAVLTAGVARPSHAQLVITLLPPDVGATSGKTVTHTFAAMLVNNYDQPLFLNGDFATVDAPLSLDDSKFINAFVLPTDPQGDLLPQPTLAANGGEITLDIFDVTTPNTTSDGVYQGVFAIEHGFASGDLTNTTAANFLVKVSPSGTPITPEPGGTALLGGLATASLLFYRRRKAMRLTRF